MRRTATNQQPVAGQGLGVAVILGPRQLLEVDLLGLVYPAMLIGLGQAAPPNFVGKAQRPGRMVAGQADQPVAPFFFLR